MTQQRYDLYGPIHKGLRRTHADFLARLGAADFAEPTPLLDALRSHLTLCAKHLSHEEDFIHPALEQRSPGGASRLDQQHEDHREDLDRLERAITAVERAAPEDRARAGRDLYLTYATFVAADLEHMHEEETVVWPRLCALFTDAEMMGIEMAIIGSLAPEVNLAFMRMMLPALNRAERAGLLGGIKASAPPEAFAAVIQFAARPTLAPADMAALEAVGLAA
jgi:hypothetical protein